MGRGRTYEPAFRESAARRAAALGAAGRRSVARELGVSRSTIWEWQHALGIVTAGGARIKVEVPPAHEAAARETVEQTRDADSLTVKMANTPIRTFEELCEACDVDMDEWEYVSFTCKSNQMIYVPRATRDSDQDGWVRATGDGHARQVQLFAVSATFKRKTPVIEARAEIEALIADAKTQVVRMPLVVVKPPRSGYMLELTLPDLHFGRLAWGRETGGADYDLGIACETYYKAVETLLARSAAYQFERVLFVVGNDLLNADSNDGLTTRGTRQDMDSRHFKVFQAARRAKTSVAERLAAEVAPVHIITMPGNHDRLSTMHLGDALFCWFHEHKHVTVDVEPTPRKYHQWGTNGLGFNHGDEGKPVDWSRLFAHEAPAIWAATQYREIHTAHLHKDAIERDEINGVKIRRMPSLASPDYWHAFKGYVGNIPTAEALHWHATDGLVGTAVYSHQAAA